ncbi:MAG TPA: HNH endonuclease signature motif containing protein, partial [Clostridia bacterium]|nr:HNH endonuclease signature motif containing protein [Clostridia bacterium]
MHVKTRNALLGYGLASDLIEKIGDRGHTLTELRALSRQKLLGQYTSEEVDQIKARIERLPIAEEVIDLVMAKAGGSCCYCEDGNNSRPFQIHHINPFSETQDNSEDNLLLVCPTHHATIHANKIRSPEQK